MANSGEVLYQGLKLGTNGQRQIVCVIGEGSTSKVVLTITTGGQLEVEVAKIVMPELDGEALEEYRLLSKLRDLEVPHVQTAFDETVIHREPDNNHRVLCFKHVGVDVGGLMTRNEFGLPPVLVSHLMSQLLTAVHGIHSHGLAHCDIKAENLLLLLTPQAAQDVVKHSVATKTFTYNMHEHIRQLEVSFRMTEGGDPRNAQMNFSSRLKKRKRNIEHLEARVALLRQGERGGLDTVEEAEEADVDMEEDADVDMEDNGGVTVAAGPVPAPAGAEPGRPASGTLGSPSMVHTEATSTQHTARARRRRNQAVTSLASLADTWFPDPRRWPLAENVPLPSETCSESLSSHQLWVVQGTRPEDQPLPSDSSFFTSELMLSRATVMASASLSNGSPSMVHMEAASTQHTARARRRSHPTVTSLASEADSDFADAPPIAWLFGGEPSEMSELEWKMHTLSLRDERPGPATNRFAMASKGVVLPNEVEPSLPLLLTDFGLAKETLVPILSETHKARSYPESYPGFTADHVSYHSFRLVLNVSIGGGTVVYLAPETLVKVRQDKGGDVWACHVMAFFLATGKLPYDPQYVTLGGVLEDILKKRGGHLFPPHLVESSPVKVRLAALLAEKRPPPRMISELRGRLRKHPEWSTPVVEMFISFLERAGDLNPETRWTAEMLLAHPFLATKLA